MKLFLCASFMKQLKKLNSVQLGEIKKVLKRYPNTDNVKEINQVNETIVLKCYLLQKKVRSIVFLQQGDTFVPVSIVKKESKKGKNITKENYEDLYNGDMLKINEDLKTKQFITEEL